MKSNRDRKYNYGYSESRFYKSGPMPYWSKKKRLRNKENKPKTQNNSKHNFALNPDQINTIIGYLNHKDNLITKISPEEFTRILGETIPEENICSRSWWNKVVNSKEWITSWKLKTVKRTGYIHFERILEI
jgi:hypothetical protein